MNNSILQNQFCSLTIDELKIHSNGKIITVDKAVYIELIQHKDLKINLLFGVFGLISFSFVHISDMLTMLVLGLVFLLLSIFIKKNKHFVQIIFEDATRIIYKVETKELKDVKELILKFRKLKSKLIL